MRVSRRVRRRLLLPPGWVALGFLLLLGCQALRPWAGQLRQWNVMGVTLPAFHVNKSAPWNAVFYQSPKQLSSFWPWQDAAFTGNKLADFLNAASTESAIRQIMADTSHAGGVRIRFLPGATYANLVKVLDIMNYTDQKKYWLDIHHEPTTLYAITDVALPAQLRPLSMGGCIIMMSPPPVKPTFKQLLLSFWQQMESLRERVWRVPTILLNYSQWFEFTTVILR